MSEPPKKKKKKKINRENQELVQHRHGLVKDRRNTSVSWWKKKSTLLPITNLIVDRDALQCTDANQQSNRPLLGNSTGASINKEVTCEVCGKMFASVQSRDLHTNSHTGAKPFECYQCDKKFAQPAGFSKHLQHSFERIYKCQICDKTFATSSDLSAHRQMHSAPKFECPFCSKKFTRSSDCRTHWKGRKHNAIGCKVRLNQLALVNKSIRLSPEESLVPTSSMTSSLVDVIANPPPSLSSDEEETVLSNAMAIVNSDPHQCSIASSSSSNIDEPQQNPTDAEDSIQFQPRTNSIVFITQKKNKFTCNICEKVFQRKSYLRLHMNSHNVKKSFPQSPYYRHRKTHLFPATSNCDGQFEKMLARSSCVTEQQTKHSAPTKFECPFCEKKFPQSSNCIAHWNGSRNGRIACKVRRIQLDSAQKSKESREESNQSPPPQFLDDSVADDLDPRSNSFIFS